MAGLLDRGDSYQLQYLGSIMMTHASTGLGMLQKPLRELYFKYKQGKNAEQAQERRLVLTGKGITMSYQENPATIPQEIFYGMPDIVFWDAVQFVTVKGPDKKYRGAFEPLDIDHTPNKDNLFSVIEKKFHYLLKQSHQPLFVCALRRTSGVKAIDVHAFVCPNDDEALSLMRSLDNLQQMFNSDAEHFTGVFEYRPFPENRTPSGSVRSQDVHLQRHMQGQHPGYSVQEEETPPVQAKSPVRFGVPAIGPQAGYGVPRPPPKRADQGEPRPPPRRADQEPPQAAQAQSYRLTQEHFQGSQQQPSYETQHHQYFQSAVNMQYNQQGYPQAYNNRPYRAEPSGNDTYEYIRHIDKDNVMAKGQLRGQAPTLPPRGDPRDPSVYTTTLATRGQGPIHPDYREDYNSMTRDMYVADSTLYGGQSTYADDGEYMRTLSRDNGGGNPFDQFPSRSAPHFAGQTSTVGGHTMAYANDSTYKNDPPYQSQLPERELIRMRNMEYGNNAHSAQNRFSQSSQYSNLGNSNFGQNSRPVSHVPPLQQKTGPEPPTKPVAMVHPRKVQGVKVLPNVPATSRSDETSSQENNARNSRLSNGSDYSNQPSSSGRLSPVAPKGKFNDYYDNREIRNDQPKKNWQFMPSTDESDPPGTLRPTDEADQFKTTDEKRHQRWKKEAEIASAFSEMHVDDKTFKMSDFEKGLGYLP